MARGEKLKLETGKTYLVTLKYVDYTKSEEYGDEQIRVTGQWDGVGLGHTYLPHGAVQAFLKCGAVEQKGEDENNNPVYQVVKANSRVQITRRQGQGNSKTTDVTLPGQAAAAPASGGGKAAAPAAGGEPRGSGTMPVTAKPGVARLGWALLDEAARAAVKIAVNAMTEALGCQKNDLDQQAVVSLTATVLIRAEEFQVPVALGLNKSNGGEKKEPERREPPARQPAAAGSARVPAGGGPEEEDDDLPF